MGDETLDEFSKQCYDGRIGIRSLFKRYMSSKAPEKPSSTTHSLGQYLANVRRVKGLTLREVEDATDQKVSNAYLSQLENDKISKPSPNVLHTLATVYAIRYEVLMEKAGYIAAVEPEPKSTRRHGRAATFANADLTLEEEEQLLDYLAFLRSRKR